MPPGTSRAVPDRRRVALLALAGALPVLLHAARTLSRFDGLYGQDAYAYFAYAVGPLAEALAAQAALPPFAWPPGYPLLVAASSLLVGPVPLAGQLVSVAAGALVAVASFLIAREIQVSASDVTGAGLGVPALAGLLAGFTPQLLQSSVVVMSDTASLAAATLGVWSLARYLREPPAGGGTARLGWLLAAAALLACAVLVRWAAALVVLAAMVLAGVALPRSLRARPSALLAHAAAALLVGLVVLAPVLGPALASLSGQGSPGNHTVDLDHVLPTWSPANALRASFENTDGSLSYPQSNLLFCLLAPARHAFLTPVFALALPVGLWRVLAARRAGPIALLVAWPALVTVFLAGISWQNFRYTLLLLPPLAILAALGIDAVWRSASRRGRALVGGMVAAGFVWMTIAGHLLTERFVERKNDDLELIAWTEARLPSDALLVTFSVTGAFRHYSELDVREIYNLDEDTVTDLAASDRPFFLLLDLANLERQWRAMPPELNFRRFQTARRLVVHDSRPPFTLFRAPPASIATGTGER